MTLFVNQCEHYLNWGFTGESAIFTKCGKKFSKKEGELYEQSIINEQLLHICNISKEEIEKYIKEQNKR